MVIALKVGRLWGDGVYFCGRFISIDDVRYGVMVCVLAPFNLCQSGGLKILLEIIFVVLLIDSPFHTFH